ncbi:TPA: hypothetical protein SIF59_004278 [Escherichia coli]|nr:hypothetical protein [Escherichia coli]
MNKHKLGVVLNGPPGCGKDTIANIIVSGGLFVKHQFKDALYEHTAKHFQIDLDKFIHYAADRNLKDSKSLAGLGGRTPREALIYVSEVVYKPRHGSDYFGLVEARNLEEHVGRLGGSIDVIYPDGGFTSELAPIERVLDSLVIIRLHRSGFDFKGDSRNYIYLPDTEKRTSFDVYLTDNDIQGGVAKVIERINIVKDWNS